MAATAAPPWSVLPQRDFSAGMFRGVARHLIPPNGLYTALNGLYDDEGSVYRRGGSEYQSNGGLGSAGLRWMWDGQLGPGARTLVASSAKWGVLDSDDQTIIDMGSGGLTAPTRASVVGGLLFIGGGTVYGGSRKAADYSTGTAATTAGSAIVTGTGTSWTANVDAGMLFKIGTQPIGVVKSVDSNTQITLAEPRPATLATTTYTLKRFQTADQHVSGSSNAAPIAEIYATIADRLVAAIGDTISFSAERSATDGSFQTYSFDPTDNHKVPGMQVLGLEPLRDTMMVFATGGVYAITNMAYDLTDASGNVQQGFERVNSDLILWSKEGIATYGNLLVVPCVDAIYTLGVAQGPQPVSRSIFALYQSYVRAGYKPGVATVYRSHYLLPILDASNAQVDMLVCRLDRPVDTPIGVCFPFSQVQGHAGNVTALATRVGSASGARSPQLLAASRATGSRVLKLGAMWEPAAGVKNDADATTHPFTVETRDTITGGEDLNMVRRLRVRYELVDAGSDDPTLTAYVSTGEQSAAGTLWGAFNWGGAPWSGSDTAEFEQLPTVGPEDPGRTPHTWAVRRRARYVRARVTCSQPCAKLTLRSTEWWVRPSGLSR